MQRAMPVKMYTSNWCGDCWRARRFLQKHKIDFEEINISDSDEAATLVMSHNGGKRRVPTFDINGSFHGNPPLSKLAALLGVDL
jgi:mycoredoxin